MSEEQEASAEQIMAAWKKCFPNNMYAWPGVPKAFALEAARVILAKANAK